MSEVPPPDLEQVLPVEAEQQSGQNEPSIEIVPMENEQLTSPTGDISDPPSVEIQNTINQEGTIDTLLQKPTVQSVTSKDHPIQSATESQVSVSLPQPKVQITPGLNQDESSIRKKTSSLPELIAFLSNLPSAQVNRKHFIKDELQVRVAKDLSALLRNVPHYMSLVNNSSDFHIDDLVNYLLRQFVTEYKSSFHDMSKQLTKAEAQRQQQIVDLLND